MPFPSGNVSFRQFVVIGQAPSSVDEQLIDKVKGATFAESTDEVSYGWVGGRHLYDLDFNFENNVLDDAMHFGLRIDTNQVPGPVKKSYLALEEAALAADNPSGFISKLQKKEAKEIVQQRVEEEQKTGKFRRSKMIPILWDLGRGRLYAAITGKALEKLMEIFERTFGLQLAAVTAGTIARDFLGVRGQSGAFEDLRPTKFTESEFDATYPWSDKFMTVKDFLGDEFLLWALWQTQEEGDTIPTLLPDGPFRNVTLMFDRSLGLECSFGQTGKHQITGSGPDRLPETREAIRSGKVPRKAGVTAMIADSQYEFTFNPEAFAFGGTKLPDIENADSPRVAFEERIKLISDLCQGMERLFQAFVDARTNGSWTYTLGKIVAWISPEDVEATEEVES